MEGPEPNPDEVRNRVEESRKQTENIPAAEVIDEYVAPSNLCETNNEKRDENATDQLGEKEDQKSPPKKVGGVNKKVSFVIPSETDVNPKSR